MSDESDVPTLLKFLKADANARQLRLNQLNSVIRMYESELERPDNSGIATEKTSTDGSAPASSTVPPATPSTGTYSNKYPGFPKDEHLIQQIPYILRHRGVATRFPDLQDAINAALNGEAVITEHQLRGNMSKLLDDKEMARVKFNNSNLQVYYVFPDWIETDESGKKQLIESAKPSRKDLPTGYHVVEFL